MKSQVFDPHVPASLKELQLWFGGIIQQKMTDERAIHPLAPNGVAIEEEAKRYVQETGDLPAWERLGIYNQAYWLRLLEALHEDFPMLLRLFGEEGFDRLLGIPYLDRYPSTHWSLHFLPQEFPSWVSQEYKEEDRILVEACTQLDYACQELFVVKEFPPLDLTRYQGEGSYKLLQKKLVLQSTVRLFEFPAHFLHFRKELLAHPPEYWETHDFPSLEKGKTFYFVVYRSPQLIIEWQELSKEAYLVLRELDLGSTLEEVCDRIDLDHVGEEIAFWIQEWLLRGWLRGQITTVKTI